MSPRVDFYLLPVAEPQARITFACRLAEKAWHAGHRVYLHGADEATAATIDAELWRFRDTAFVPHERAPAGAGCPVVVGCGAPADTRLEVLITLDETLPPFFGQFARVAEILLNEPEARAAGRLRWSAYREHGCALDTHNIASLRGGDER